MDSPKPRREFTLLVVVLEDHVSYGADTTKKLSLLRGWGHCADLWHRFEDRLYTHSATSVVKFGDRGKLW